jgi:hypothetical protein
MRPSVGGEITRTAVALAVLALHVRRFFLGGADALASQQSHQTWVRPLRGRFATAQDRSDLYKHKSLYANYV